MIFAEITPRPALPRYGDWRTLKVRRLPSGSTLNHVTTDVTIVFSPDLKAEAPLPVGPTECDLHL